MTVTNANYQLVTDRLVSMLESGAAPWRKPWAEGVGPAALGRPLRVGGQPYKGINTVNLWIAAQLRGYTSPYWMTFKAAQAYGAHVKKGERAEAAFFAGSATKTKIDENTGEESEDRFSFLKSYAVFNAGQIEDLPDHFYVTAKPAPPIDAGKRHAEADRFVDASGATLRHGGDRAYFSPSTDHIQMPLFDAFSAPEGYYSTLLHELTHWTSAPKRCDRVLGKRFGDNAYAVEELIAELGAAFLCADLGVTSQPREDHASYLASWIKVLKEDNRAIFRAAAHAERACGFLHELAEAAPDRPAAPIATPATPEPIATPDPTPEPPKPPRPRKPVTTPEPVEPAPIGARRTGKPHWSDHATAAWNACKAEHGPHAWATSGAVWVDLAVAERSWLSPDRVRIRWTRDQLLPAPHFWPAGTFPKALRVVARPVRRITPDDAKRDARARICAAAIRSGCRVAGHADDPEIVAFYVERGFDVRYCAPAAPALPIAA
jgi:antirestriction protein ArdC